MKPMGTIFKQLLFILLTAILWSACSSVEEVQEVDDYKYKLIYSISKKTGKKEGLYKKYSPEGWLYESAYFSNDQLNGERRLMYPNGQVEILENYQNDNYEGISKIFYEDGALKNEGQYRNNVAEGTWKGYYPNGQLKEEVLYANNQEEGPFKEWHENGEVKAEGTYKGGDNEHGELKLYDTNGQLERKMDCAMGACSTTWKSDKATDET